MIHPRRSRLVACLAISAAALTVGAGPANIRAAELDLTEAHTATPGRPYAFGMVRDAQRAFTGAADEEREHAYRVTRDGHPWRPVG